MNECQRHITYTNRKNCVNARSLNSIVEFLSCVYVVTLIAFLTLRVINTTALLNVLGMFYQCDVYMHGAVCSSGVSEMFVVSLTYLISFHRWRNWCT